MGIATATLNGIRVTAARIAIPAWGASHQDVTLDGDITIAAGASVVLVVADLTIKCTVLSGGPASGRSYFRLVAGAGGWGKTIPRRSYANDLGVKLATVLGDAAQAVGETLDMSTIDTSIRLGPSFVRPEGPASRALEVVAENAWYIGEDGQTRLGQRPKVSLSIKAPRTTNLDSARGTVTLASESIAGILPGLVVDGLEAVDVEHEISSKAGLRSKIWGRRGTGNSRRLAAFRAIFDQLDPDRQFRGIFEYRIVFQDGERLSLQPVRVSLGMPDLQRVYVRPGVPGVKAGHRPGMRVLVGFVDSDPAKPAVLGFEDAEGFGFLPNALEIYGGGAAIGRVGDQVQVTFDSTAVAGITKIAGASAAPCVLTAGPFTLTGTITSGSTKVSCG